MRVAVARVGVLFALALAACGSTTPPVDEGFDGNVVVGDATPGRDAGATDRGLDAADDATALDAAPLDAAADAGLDAGRDAGRADAQGMDAMPSCDLLPALTLTATSAAQRAVELAGTVVDVVGTATVSALRCTGLDCSDAGACCNTCTADVSIDGVLPLLASECTNGPLGCTGSECAQVCRPAVLGVPETFRGRLVAPGGVPGLELLLVAP